MIETPKAGPALVEVRGLRTSLGDKVIFDGIDLDIARGKITAIMGPSGTGKTTLLRHITGQLLPDAGEIRVDGRNVPKLSRNELFDLREKIGFLFQNSALLTDFSVFENIAFPLRVRRTRAAEVAERVRHVAELAGIVDCLPRRPGQLSGGQQQRVALCRALVKEPAVLLLDEPLSNLDARLREVTRAEIRRLQRELGITTLFVSHDQAEALSIADRVGVMHSGRLIALMTPSDLYHHPPSRFVAEFIGTPPMNFLPARVEDGRLAVAGGAPRRLGRPLPAGGYVLGIRAEHLELAADGDLHAEVALVEQIGREWLVHAACGDTPVRVLVGTGASVAAGLRIALRLAWRHAHLFDQSGAVVPFDLADAPR
ncbi:MAG TPA: ABC transporter ATP-binding protein [bacterium]|nr:ABC transporter ATP-binding protein [bacterium]